METYESVWQQHCKKNKLENQTPFDFLIWMCGEHPATVIAQLKDLGNSPVNFQAPSLAPQPPASGKEKGDA